MDYVVHIIILILLYSILGVSLNLVLGFTGMLSVGHAAFFGLGAFGSGLLAYYLGVNFIIGMLGGIVIAMAMGMIVSIPALRVKDEFLVLLTIGFNMVIFGILVTQKDLTGGRWGIVGIPKPSVFGMTMETPLQNLPLVFLGFLVCFAISWRIVHSPFGRVLRAIRDDELATKAIGKNILIFKVTVFVIASGLAAIAGSLLAHYHAYVEPRAFTVDESIFLLAIVVIGGSGNLLGSVIGASFLVGIPEVLTFMPGAEAGLVSLNAIRVGLYGLMLVLFMRFRPQGILPETIGSGAGASTYIRVSEGEKKETLHSEPKIQTLGKAKSMSDKSPLRTERLRKYFGGIRAVDNVSLEFPRGKVTALIGPNGAGKTTVFNLLTGFIRADSGKIFLHGQDITNYPPHKINRLGMARSFQEVRIFPHMRVVENVLIACGKQSGENLANLFFLPGNVGREEKDNRQRAMAYLDFVGLIEKAELMAGDIAFAEQKLLVFASLLATNSEVLLIDELVSGIDPASIDKVLGMVRQMADWGKSICIIEHNLDVVKGIADSTYFLAEGKVIAAGTPAELMSKPELAEIYFGS
jgi:branched-chain amino acid transport system permease protein